MFTLTVKVNVTSLPVCCSISKTRFPSCTYPYHLRSRFTSIHTTEDTENIISAEIPPHPSRFPVGSDMHETSYSDAEYCAEPNETWARVKH